MLSAGWMAGVLDRPFGGARRRRNANALLLTLAAAALAAWVQVTEKNAVYPGGGLSGPLYAFESSLQDAVVRSRPPERYGSSIGQDPRSVITLVAMDEPSLAELGVFRSWPRAYYADVVDNLLAAPPRVIAFDVGFFEPSADDARLAAAFDRARALRPPTAIVIGAAGSGSASVDAAGEPSFGEGLQPVPAIADHALVAFANVLPDERGVVRSMPLVARVGGAQQPTLGLAAVASYLRLRDVAVQRVDPGRMRLGSAGQAVRDVPVDATDSVRINFFGPPWRTNAASTFRVVSFVDVLRARADPSQWRDGIVLVGLLGTTGFADDWWTPVSDQGLKMAGVEVHANVAATLLSTEYLREAPLPVQLLVIVGLALVVGLLAANMGVVRGALVALALLGGFVLVNLALFDQTGWQLPLANPLGGAVLAFGAVTVYRVVVEERQARALQTALASVIPASVAQEIAREPERVRIGGERRVVSVLFSDVVGFTGFSETIEPELLTRIMAEYLEAMTAAVFRHRGTLDKFIGDAIMALWNAPLDDPHHARAACEAALDMQTELRRLCDAWAAQGLARHRMRVGIHTGPASVGNMGTTRRFAYTALGDTVNLAARLEPLNNEYGTGICISQATLDQAGGRERFLVRFLDLVVVHGKHAPVAVYELLGRTDDEDLVKSYAPLLDVYERGIALYRARHFAAALELFYAAAGLSPSGADGPSAVYVDRCQRLMDAPPAEDWDGVYVMRHK
jgi:adenylate cyclase